MDRVLLGFKVLEMFIIFALLIDTESYPTWETMNLLIFADSSMNEYIYIYIYKFSQCYVSFVICHQHLVFCREGHLDIN